MELAYWTPILLSVCLTRVIALKNIEDGRTAGKKDDSGDVWAVVMGSFQDVLSPENSRVEELLRSGAIV